MYTNDQIRRAISKQMKIIADTGFVPKWELFEKTFGWFQIKSQITEDQQAFYKQEWERHFKGKGYSNIDGDYLASTKLSAVLSK